MAVLGIIMFKTDFNGMVYLWLVGMPIIVIIIFLRNDLRYDIVMIDYNNYDSLNQAID